MQEPNTSCEIYPVRGILSKVQKYSTKDSGSKCVLCGTCTRACPEHTLVQEQGKIRIKKDV